MATEDKDQTRTDKVKNTNSDFNERVSMGNQPDPSAKRNVGPGGDLERAGQKDKLQNMHIKGNETTGYGANDPNNVDSFTQGPGFANEGSDTAMDDKVNGVRSKDQPLGSKNTEESDSDKK